MHKITPFFVIVAAVFLVNNAWATAISGDFHEELNFSPSFCNDPRIMESLGQAIGPGFELDEADEIDNPCGYGDSILVDYDPSTNLLRLTPSGSNNYQIIDIDITNLVFSVTGEQILGLVEISDDLIDVASSGPFSRSESFTGNSITIGYVVDNLDNDSDRLEFSSGEAVFQVVLESNTAPVPAMTNWSIVLLIGVLGILGLAIIRRTTQKKF